MNQKVYSVFFCALLASTFIHEIRARSEAFPLVKRAAEISSHDEALQPVKRSIDSEECTDEEDQGITVSVNVNLNLTIFVNESAKVAIVVDVNANIIALFNGTSGECFLIWPENNKGMYISDGVWIAVNLSIDAFVDTLENGLTDLLSLVCAVEFALSAITEDLFTPIRDILYDLLEIDLEIPCDPETGIKVLVDLFVEILVILNAKIEIFTELLGNNSLTLPDDITDILCIVDAVVDLLGDTDSINATEIEECAKEPNGLDVLSCIIEDLDQIDDNLSTILNDSIVLPKIAAELGGNDNSGINGVLRAIVNVVLFIQGEISLEVMINVILLFLSNCPTPGSNTAIEDPTTEFINSCQRLLNTVVSLNATEEPTVLIAVLEGIIEGTFVKGGVNASAILTLLLNALTGTVPSLLQVLVQIILLLGAVVDNVVGLLTCLLVLLINLLSPLGIQILIKLGLIVDITLDLTGNLVGELTKLIGKSVKIRLGNIFGALVSLPVVGKIVLALDSVISSLTGGKISLKKILNSKGPISELIKGAIQLLTGVNLKVSATVIAQVKELIEEITGITFCLGIDDLLE